MESCLLQYHLAENSTLSLLQRVCSSMTISVQGKAVFHWFTCFITTEPAWLSSQQSEGAVQFPATWWPFQPRDPTPTPTPLSPLSSSLPTKWMTAFRNTRVRHDSEVHMLCHLCSTCFDASAAREAENDHACNSTSSQLMVQAWYCIKAAGLITPLQYNVWQHPLP